MTTRATKYPTGQVGKHGRSVTESHNTVSYRVFTPLIEHGSLVTASTQVFLASARGHDIRVSTQTLW